MWTIEAPASRPYKKLRLEPHQVLYEFDGPQIFVSVFGFISAFFVKSEDLDDTFLWTAASVDDKTCSYVEKGRVSVRCPFLQDFIWIVRTDFDLNVVEFWSCPIESVPEDMLPASGATLNGQLDAPDSVAQADAFFALRFAGDNISTYGPMRFGQYKQLVDNAYEAVRRILGPASLAGSRSNVYDFDVRQAAGSVIIAVDKPVLNQRAIKARFKKLNIAPTDVSEEIENVRDEFLRDVSSIIANTNSVGGIDRVYNVLDYIIDILPNDKGDLSSVTFSAAGSAFSTTIDRETGKALQTVHQELSTREATEIGRVEIINSKTNSFVIFSEKSRRQVTCYATPEYFSVLAEDSRFRNNVRITISGDFWSRPNRDAIKATEMPRIIA